LWIYVAITLIILLIVVVAVFPTPHTRIRTEQRSTLEDWLNCSGTLKDGYYWHWDLTDLPSNVRIVVNIGSTEEVSVYIKSVEGVVSNQQKKVHDYTLYAKGPSLYVKVENPTIFGLGPSAVVSGEIKVYHDYEAQVRYTEWVPWWMP
jgi:hypothetical protein